MSKNFQDKFRIRSNKVYDQCNGQQQQLDVIILSPKKSNPIISTVRPNRKLTASQIFSGRFKTKEQSSQLTKQDKQSSIPSLLRMGFTRIPSNNLSFRTPVSNETLNSQRALAKQFQQKRSQHTEYIINSYNRRKQSEKERQFQQQRQRKEKEFQSQRQRLKKKNHQISAFLGDLIGISGQPSKKVKKDEGNDDPGLKNIALLDRMQDQLQFVSGADFYDIEQKQEKRRRQMFGIATNEIVANYRPQNPTALIRLILSHDFHKDFLIPQNKKIPPSFKNSMIYVKTFHYLLANECIADIQQRLKKVEMSKEEPIQASIVGVRKNNQGFVQIILREQKSMIDPPEKDTFQLKNYSLSKYRLGLITNKLPFKVRNYGVPSKNSKLQFSFLCILATPQTREDLRSDVKVLGCIKEYELEMVRKQTSVDNVYYIDFEKISTHIREYKAVSDMPLFDLAPYILNPKILEQHQTDIIECRDVLNPILQVLQKQFNVVQYNSIRQMVLREYGVVMLQGPPGTGKTSTLLGLLSAQYQYFRLTTGSSIKIMVCAPSNAAIDHIVKRITLEGLYCGEGVKVFPRILRTGIVQNEDPAIREVSLDHICEKQILKLKESNLKSTLSTPQIRQMILTLQKQLKKLFSQKAIKQEPNIDEKIAKKNNEIKCYKSQLFQFRREKVQLKTQYSQIQKRLINEAEIILTTLSSSGNDKIDRIRGQIGCLIVDEAAQATEPNLLIALQSGVRKVLLIGDPYQLPSTTMSTDSSATLFNRSLFQRFIDAGLKPYFLNIQYRMEPLIRQFPSKSFYQNRLQDSSTVLERRMPYQLRKFKSRNVLFLDINFGGQKRRQSSFINQGQASAITELLRTVCSSQLTVGVITPYQQQRRLIVKYMGGYNHNIKVNTVDSFQGQEKDIILVSCVRSNSRANIGFMQDERRINVTLTRAKFLLIVVGNGDTLGSNEVWNSFLNFCQDKKSYYRVNFKMDCNQVIGRMLEGPNQQPITRQAYNQYTRDSRKLERTQIKGDDFLQNKKNNRQKNNKQPIVNNGTLNSTNSIMSPHCQKGNGERSQFPYQYQYKSSSKSSHKQVSDKIHKRASGMKVQDLLQEKQQKLQKGFRFQEINKNVNQMERKIINGEIEDDFLKQLYK